VADNNNLRLTEVAVTKEYSGGVPVWTNAVIYTVPEGASAFSFAAFGDTQYAVRRRTQDVFGQYSEWSSYAEHTTLSGADSLTTSALDHEITETEIADDSISTPKLQANSVTAGKLLVGYNGSGNLLADGDFSWYGIGDTQYWTTGTDWSVVAASGTSQYEHGRWRCRFNGTSIASAAYMTSLQPVRMADHHVFSLAVLHRVESISAGTLRVQVLEYTNAGTLVATNTLQSYTSTTNMDVDGWVIAGNAYVAPTGVTVDLTLDSTTDYVIIRFGADSGTTASWYVMSASCTPGYLPTLSANTGSYYSAVDIGAGGIIIYNGKLIFQDEYGQTAMDGYGFGGNWVKYIHNRVYNGDFSAGSTSAIAASETGSGSGTANYKNSISPDLPHWVVKTASASGDLKLVADSTASGGYALQTSGSSGTSSWYQDIPIVPGEQLIFYADVKYDTPGSSEFQFNKYISYRKSDHSITGSEASGGLVYTSGTVGLWFPDFTNTSDFKTPAPADAAYIRVRYEIVHQGTGTSTFAINELKGWNGDGRFDSLYVYGDQIILGGITVGDSTSGLANAIQAYGYIDSRRDNSNSRSSFRLFKAVSDSQPMVSSIIDSSGYAGISLGAGGSSSQDVSLLRTEANVLKLADGDVFDVNGVGRKITKNTTQSISHSAWNQVTSWVSSEWAGLYSSYSNNGVKVTRAGLYLITGTIEMQANTDYTRIILGIGFGANTTPSSPAAIDEVTHSPNTSNISRHVNGTWVYQLAANDVVGLFAHHTNGASASRNLVTAILSVVRIGDA
jgi:hypothetical protein